MVEFILVRVKESNFIQMVNYNDHITTLLEQRILEQIPLKAVLRHWDEDREMMQEIQHDFTKGKSYFISLVAFYDGGQEKSH